MTALCLKPAAKGKDDKDSTAKNNADKLKDS
jgi:hypothetical protein